MKEANETKDHGAAGDLPLWHAKTAGEVCDSLQVDSDQGLTAAEVARRTTDSGHNVLPDPRRRGPWGILFGQFTDFMILILLWAAVISGFIGEPEDTITILVIVVLNGLIGFVQEYRAERALAALKSLAAATARVRRDGHDQTIPAADLVPGDIVFLQAGNLVPADLRLISAMQLRLDESVLTGESVPVEKNTEPCAVSAGLGDRMNLAFRGTTVTYGRGCGVVVATGMGTALGRIAQLLQSTEQQKTPLQKRLGAFGGRLSLIAIVFCALVFLIGVSHGEELGRMLLTAISLAVAAIPEALPAVVTIALALGARGMVQKHALICRLPAVETLGSVTYICSDKTGTLTENRMRVESIYAGGSLVPASTVPYSQACQELLLALAVSNDASVETNQTPAGDPTEVALCEAAAAAGYEKDHFTVRYPRIAEIPFDAVRKRMTTFHRGDDVLISFTKGAPEAVVDRCRMPGNADHAEMSWRDRLLEQAERMASSGLRVLAFASRRWDYLPEVLDTEVIERGLDFLGFVGLIDPPRAEAAGAVAQCREAGIVPVMITGDHPSTARAIAIRLGIVGSDAAVMTGDQLDTLSDTELDRCVQRIGVYARVAPEQKIKIVQRLQQRGELVAMTGDGVNDAPALQQADIGVAMGLGGTDVAREAAHMILLDDNFATIVAAVREGRRIYDNIRKFVKYCITCNSAEIWTLFVGPLLGLPVPLLPIHILWINLLTDGIPGLALAVEPEERGIMQRPPRPPNESMFARGLWQHMVWVGVLMAGITLATQAVAYHMGSHWQTMVFTVLGLSQLGHILAIRSERESLFTQGILSNQPLFWAVVGTMGLQLCAIYLPFLNRLLKTQPLSSGELVVTLIASGAVFVAVELEKSMVRRGWIYRFDPVRSLPPV